MKEINQILDFVIEIEKLKSVLRKSRPVGLERYENSSEHSWHVCLSALMLKEYANENVDINQVIKMLLIHDLGEIDAGDTIIYASETIEIVVAKSNWPPYKSHSKIISLFGLVSSRGCAYEV